MLSFTQHSHDERNNTQAVFYPFTVKSIEIHSVKKSLLSLQTDRSHLAIKQTYIKSKQFAVVFFSCPDSKLSTPVQQFVVVVI